MTLSVTLIVKDEEAVLSRCLNAARKFADEIIVVDTGSTDQTKNIARKFTDKVYDFEWVYDFSAARNFALSKAECDFIMWLDADDFIDDANVEKIKKIKADDGFDLGYLYYVSEDGDGNPSFKYYRERIFRRSENFAFAGAVHEAVSPRGRLKYFDAEIRHRKEKEGDPLRNIDIILRQIAAGKQLDGRMKYYYGRELLTLGAYRESIAVFEDFLSGEGWVENKIDACICLSLAHFSIFEEAEGTAALFRSFTFAPPRSEACCGIGERLLSEGNLEAAAFWYELALTRAPDPKSGAFVNLDYCGFIPNIQLAVIYDRMGDFSRAKMYNEAAGAIKPRHPAYLYNKEYFEKILKE